MNNSGIFVTVNASGAAEAAERGCLIMVVDIIDMSTTLESALDAGALAVYGASPDKSRAPVKLNPEKIGRLAGKMAVANNTGVIIISEPRVGTDEERRARAAKTITGVEAVGAGITAILPNIGAETAKLADFTGKVVVAVTDTGGVAFDAAMEAGAVSVITGTVARTIKKRGTIPARAAAIRAIEEARKWDAGIAVVAASANSLEDILAAEYIARLIIEEGFTSLS
jgi:hypothetical protein